MRTELYSPRVDELLWKYLQGVRSRMRQCTDIKLTAFNYHLTDSLQIRSHVGLRTLYIRQPEGTTFCSCPLLPSRITPKCLRTPLPRRF